MPVSIIAEQALQGFDSDAQWQFLPQFANGASMSECERYVYLLGGPDCTVTVANSSIAAVVDLSSDPEKRRLLLLGQRLGNTTLDIRDKAGKLVLQWNLEVIPKVVTVVETHLVRGVKGEGTVQSNASVRLILEAANRILKPQAYIELLPEFGSNVAHREMSTLIIVDPGASRRDIRRVGRQQEVLTRAMKNSMNITHAFFVRMLVARPDDAAGGLLGWAPSHFRRQEVLIVEDLKAAGGGVEMMGQVLAHEFFHACTRVFRHVPNAGQSRKDILMWGNNDKGFTPGQYLSQGEIRTLRRNA